MKTKWSGFGIVTLILISHYETIVAQELETGVWILEIERPTAPVVENKLTIKKTIGGYEVESPSGNGKEKPIEQINIDGDELSFKTGSTPCLLMRKSEASPWRGTCPPNVTFDTPGALSVSLRKLPNRVSDATDSADPADTTDTPTVGSDEAAPDSADK